MEICPHAERAAERERAGSEGPGGLRPTGARGGTPSLSLGEVEAVHVAGVADDARTTHLLLPLHRLEDGAIAFHHGEEPPAVVEPADHGGALGGAVAAVDDGVR